MDIRTLQLTIIDALEDVKAQDIMVFDTRHLTSLFDRVIVASGTSNRQTRGLAMSVRERVKTAGGDVISMEGLDTGEWVLVDCGDAIVHIMQPMIRAYYRLEEIWGDKPITVTLNQNKKSARFAQEEDSEPTSDAPVAKKTVNPEKPARKKAAPAKTTSAKKTSVTKKTPTTKKISTKTPAAKKTTPARKPALHS